MNANTLALVAGALLSMHALAGPGVDKEFSMMDADRDGKVSTTEHAAGAKAMFGRMDANGDGKVTAAEMTAANKSITGHAAKKSEMSAADKIKVVDADGDGILTAAEHEKASAAMFVKMDANMDGFLFKDEMAGGHAAMMKK